MNVISKDIIKLVLIFILLLISLAEFILLVRHDVIKNIMINRGLINETMTDRPDYHCLLGWKNTLEKLGYKADACFFGNSITFNSNFKEDYPNKKIVNLGYSGDNIKGMLLRYKQISSVMPEKIFILAGHNDLVDSRLTMKNFRNSYTQLIDSIQASNPNSNIYLESILPVNHQMKSGLMSSERIIEANRVIKAIAEERSLYFIDLFSLYADKNNELPMELTTDGVHLKPASYKRWSEIIRRYLD